VALAAPPLKIGHEAADARPQAKLPVNRLASAVVATPARPVSVILG
jgi:hypothetical protein